MMEKVMLAVDDLQDRLSFSGCTSMHFDHPQGMGRIGVSGCIIGVVFGIHAGLLTALLVMGISSWFSHAVAVWAQYVMVLCAFHFMEFFSTALYQPSNLSCDSFLLNHSRNYTIAALCSWLEYWLEVLLLGERKLHPVLCCAGLAIALLGQLVRTAAMWQCGENFSHQIAHQKASKHQLVSRGVYRFLRHPSYFGWFHWSVGTQLLLCNPICCVLYAVVAWRFFKERIAYEEDTLTRFFGDEYRQYVQRSVTGVPLVFTAVAPPAASKSS